MHAPAIAALLVLGFLGVWFGLVEDFEVGFALALACWATATFMVFSGRPGQAPPARPKGALEVRTARPPRAFREARLPVAIAVALLAGATGIWLGLVEDIKIAMLLGIVIWAGAVLATFRGKAAF